MSGAFYDIKGIVMPPSGSFRSAYHVTYFLACFVNVREGGRVGAWGGTLELKFDEFKLLQQWFQQ